MNQQTFRWCFIGTGTLAKPVAREITASGRHEIATVYSRRFEKAAEFAAACGGTACPDAESAIRQADGVYVVTPHTSHYAYVKKAIELGKPVLCEKPFTVKAEETRELFALAREKQVYIVEGMWTWFAPAALKVKEWVTEGVLGEIEDVITNFRVNVVNYAPRLTDPALAGGAILDSGVYPITYLYRLFGKPVRVQCTGVIEGGVDLTDEIDLTFADGRTCHIPLSICDPANDNSLRLIGSKADVYVNHINAADYVDLIGKDGRVLEHFARKTTMLDEFDQAVEEIRKGRTESAIIPPQATMDVMEIMDECRRQIGLVYPFEEA